MEIEETARLAGHIGVIVGAIVAVAAVFKLPVAALRVLLAYQAWRRRRSIQGLLIQPTLEEAARYSAKLPERLDAEEAAYEKQANLRAQRRRKVQARGISLAMFLVAVFVGIAARFAYLRVTEGSSGVP